MLLAIVRVVCYCGQVGCWLLLVVVECCYVLRSLVWLRVCRPLLRVVVCCVLLRVVVCRYVLLCGCVLFSVVVAGWLLLCVGC